MNNACVVFLIEESPSQQMRIVEGTHSKIESIATAINSAIRQMEGRRAVDVALLGYRRNRSGDVDIGSRFGGIFAGRTWVSSDELVANPLHVEVRTKHMVNPVTHAVTPMTVDFPVWYQPSLGIGDVEYTVAFDALAETLQAWVKASDPIAPPLVFSFLCDLQPGTSIANAVTSVGKVSTEYGYPLLLQFHAGVYATVPVIKYPSVSQFLPVGPVQELFFACSTLDNTMMEALRQNQEFPAAGAKGLIYNGRMIDMVRMLGLLKTYQFTLPEKPSAPEMQANTVTTTQSTSRTPPRPPEPARTPSTPPTPPTLPTPPENRLGENRIQMPDLLHHGNVFNSIFEEFDSDDDIDDSLSDIPSLEDLPDVEAEIIPDGFDIHCRPLPNTKPVKESANLPPRQTLIVLLVDRSVSNLRYKPALETWKRRTEKGRFMLGEIARRGRGRYDTTFIFYGKEADGTTSVFGSEALGKTFVSDNCLLESAGIVEKVTVQIPNGIGGLIALPRKRLGYMDCSPTYPADPTPGFARVVDVVREWDAQRENKVLPPVVLHLTSGKFQVDKFDAALELLSASDLPPICVQHWVFTERPHPGVCCPGEVDFTTDATLQALWERTDALPARDFLAGVRPGIHELSRGMMVNMDFDVLFEVLDTQAQKMGGK